MWIINFTGGGKYRHTKKLKIKYYRLCSLRFCTFRLIIKQNLLITKVGNKNERFAAWIKFLIFTPKTCLLVTAEMEDCFFWSSWLFITSSSCFKTINRQEALLPTLIISHKDKFEVQIELYGQLKEKFQWYERKSIKVVHANLYTL